MGSQKMNDTEIKLLTLLNSYGDVIELDWEFDVPQILDQLQTLDSEFIIGPNGKHALNLLVIQRVLELIVRINIMQTQRVHRTFTCNTTIKRFDCWEKLALAVRIKIDAGGSLFIT